MVSADERLPEDEPRPERIGGYVIKRWLGRGAYGNAYLVERDGDSRPLALKWLRRNPEAGGPERFENERVAMERVSHKAFPAYVDHGTEDGRPFLVMTFAEGATIWSGINMHTKVQTHYSGPSVLLVAEKLLEGLQYLHAQGLLHRDIKDDNVLVSASGDMVTILDLGQCKADFLPNQDMTFWHVGASRYCPPSKFEDPSAFNPSHDVFAVGVICYRMLTNAFPWEVSKSESFGHLKALIETEPPRKIRDTNLDVDPRIIDLVMQMIEVEDYKRITIEKALAAIRQLRTALEKQVVPDFRAEKTILFPRVMRDNLHGDIELTDIERAVINTREFQRLRHIRQLGTTHLVYPGAEHSRFSHVLGVMHVVEKVLHSIEMREGRAFEPEQRRAARLYGLLHDITHAPFGHTLEDELGFFNRHDDNHARLQRLFAAPDAELPRLLTAVPHGRQVIDLLFGHAGESSADWIASLIEGPAGADVLDYIDRDAFNCGLDHRIDSAIYRWFTVDHENGPGARARHILPKLYGNHGFRVDADHAVLSILAERYALFLKVYTHPAKLAAGAMIGKALSLAIDAEPEAFAEAQVERWTDSDLLHRLGEAGPAPAQRLMTMYRERKLYRPAFRAQVLPRDGLNDDNYGDRQAKLKSLGLLEPARRLQVERDIAKDADIDDDQIIIYATRKAPGAASVSQRVLRGRNQFAVRDRIHRDHRDVFRRHLALWRVYVFSHPDLPSDKRQLVASLAARRWEMTNDVAQDRRQMDLELGS